MQQQEKVEYCHQRDFMFCELCGTMLCFDLTRYAQCPLCKHKRRVKEFVGKEITYTITSETIKRELGLVSLDQVAGEKLKKQVDHNARCEKCDRVGIEFTAAQTRSADEGQTLMYTCECGHAFNVNS